LIAFDTNVLVYAVDRADERKRTVALNLLRESPPDQAILPWQVALEFGAWLDRSIRRGQIPPDSWRLLDAYRRLFRMATPGNAALDLGLRLRRERQVQYWDAMLIGACVEAGVRTLYSEDLPSASRMEGLEIVNPFDG